MRYKALQAPFLITDDNLAKAVAISDISTRMLDHLKLSGLAGLTLWPEDLRHPFSVMPGKHLLSPEDLAGLSIRTTPSVESNKLMETLGGKPIYADSNYQGAESGLRQGSSSTGTPTATGNVTFFVKYQVLFANDAAYEKLSDNQRAILHDAGVATQKKAIAEQPAMPMLVQLGVKMDERLSSPVLNKVRSMTFNGVWRLMGFILTVPLSKTECL